MKNFLINTFLILISLVIGFYIVELVARKIEPKEVYEGSGGSYLQHETLGFVPRPGKGRVINPEFDATYIVNDNYMNDLPLESPHLVDSGNVIVLGDSHTFALGVNREQTFPWILNELAQSEQLIKGKVWNAGSIGYSLSQYLLKYRELAPKINADLVVISFSQATDLYDHIPPSRGGFVYGSTFGRIYHDLDDNGQLIEKTELVGKYSADGSFSEAKQPSANSSSNEQGQAPQATNRVNRLQKFKDKLHYRSALYRMLKRSKMAMWVATRFRPGGQSLWPGLDTSLKIELTEDDQYRMDLAKALIAQIAKEAKANGSEVLFVNIPYIATVYDDVWEASFGSQPKVYDRFLGSSRMKQICEEVDIHYLDLTNAFITEVDSKGDWLHFPIDAHPNIAGHQLIGKEILNFVKVNQLVK
jgi:hypothetical protein